MSAPTVHPVSQRLKENGITEIVLIDDAFDPPERESLRNTDVEQFWNDVKDTPDAVQELTALGISCEEPFDITAPQTKKLYESRETLKSSKTACLQLFSGVLGKIKQINQFRTPIETTLGITIQPLGVGDEFKHTSAKLIFLDYYLGVENTQKAMEAAVRKAKEIYKAYPSGGAKPLIVLMSSVREVADHKDEFRKQSNLLGGMFDFVPKEDLTNTERLFLKLGTWAMGLPEGYKIQDFVRALEDSVAAASKEFVDGVKSLTLEDYAHIQRLSLQEDGQPLGDYMLWLFGAYFGRLLFQDQPEVRKHRKQLDSLWVKASPPCQHAPTLILAEMYRSALFDNSVEDIQAHPLSISGAESADMPHIQLGDLFIRDASSEALLVVSPECDLAFSPQADRQCDPDQSVLLIPGRLQPIDEPIPKGSDLRTELFEYGGKPYRILWKKKQVRSERMGKIASCLRGFKYERKARLRLPYALQVQQSIAADLTRVGVPVAPPIFRPVKLRAYIEADDGSHKLFHDVREDAAYLLLGRTGIHFVLTVDYVVWLQDQLEGIAKGFEDRKAALTTTGGSEAGKLTQKAKDVRAFKDNFEAILSLLQAKLVKSLAKKTVLDQKILALVPDGDFKVPYDQKGQVITLVLHEQFGEEGA